MASVASRGSQCRTANMRKVLLQFTRLPSKGGQSIFLVFHPSRLARLRMSKTFTMLGPKVKLVGINSKPRRYVKLGHSAIHLRGG